MLRGIFEVSTKKDFVTYAQCVIGPFSSPHGALKHYIVYMYTYTPVLLDVFHSPDVFNTAETPYNRAKRTVTSYKTLINFTKLTMDYGLFVLCLVVMDTWTFPC